MSREESIAPEELPQDWHQPEKLRDWWKPFRINLAILRKNFRWILLTVVPVLLATLLLFEARTSKLQARILHLIAARLSYSVAPGPSAAVAFPASGPFNEARGYAELPGFSQRLNDAGFRITAQVRFSP